jgi:hypothetical protein
VAEVSLPLDLDRAEAVRTETRERFLSWPRAAGVGVFVLFALTFDLVKVQDDGVVYFDFLRRLFGVSTDGVAYQFGNAFWNAPFWLASQLVAVRGQFDHFQAGQVAVTIASNCAILVTLYFGWRILRELDLPRGPAVLLLTLFGTPVWFYGVLEPSYKHAADTLYATAGYFYLFRSTRVDARRREYLAAGLCFALLLATRYANVALVAGALVSLWVLRMRRPAGWIAFTTVVLAAVLFALPVIRHIPYAMPPMPTYGLGSQDAPAMLDHAAERLAAGVAPGSFYVPATRFDLAAPAKMLFSLHRGVFIWTPLTAFATLGFLLLLRRDRANRAFLTTLGISALALLAIHSFWGGAWDGYGSFSQRFLTALFALFLVGTAEVVRRTRRPGMTVLLLCACFSVWVGLVLFNGFYGANRHTSINQVVGAFKSVTGPRVNRYHQPPPYNSLENFGRQTGDRIKNRWELYWRLVT